MSIFDNGGGDLKSTDLPGAMLEIGFLMTDAEDTYNAGSPQFPQNQTTFTIAQNNSSITFTSALPLSDSHPGGGVIGLVPRDVFAGTTFGQFNPGTSTHSTATTLSAAFLEIASLLDDAEKLVRANVVQTQPKMVATYDVNLATRVANLVVTLPIQISRDSATGHMVIKAIDVLPSV